MAALKKILSWLFPIRVQRVEGKISPFLEVNFENGKKVLNAGEVNYSFGALHDVFRYALQKAHVVENPPEKVLILGLGAGSIVQIMVEEFGQNPEIIGVEADEKIIDLAKNEFDIDRFLNLQIENVLAEKFIAETKNKFDLIAVDVFVEANVPESCKTEKFLRDIYENLKLNGRVVFNEMPPKNNSSEDDFAKRFKKQFREMEMHELNIGGATNRILVGYKK